MNAKLAIPTDFSLVLGGPLYQACLRFRLVQPPVDLLRRRIILMAVVAWLPLLLATLLAGHAWSGVKVPFLFDVDAHARFLVSLPLLIWAEVVVHRRIRAAVQQFLDRGLIDDEHRLQFEALINSAMRLRNSMVIELVLIVLAFTFGHWLWQEQIALSVATWYAVPVDGVAHLTPAGYWYAFLSLPLARFIMLRWYYRLFIWFRFLWQISRVPLRLNPLHPDRAGGALGFMGNSVFALAPVLLAHTVLLAGLIANNIWHEGATLPDFKLEIAGVVGGLLFLMFIPLSFFVFQMEHAKRLANREYGLLASRYAAAFRQKWLDEPDRNQEPLLGTADIQSLADLAAGNDVVREMRLVPYGKALVIQLAFLISLPLFPLLLTMIPLEEMLNRAFKVLL